MRAALVVGAVALLAAAALAWALTQSGAPKRTGSSFIAGLSEQVTVRFNTWGVPHVEAADLGDLARAVGYLHANDRMLQLELGRRMSSGRLAEVVGDVALPSDRYFVGLGMRTYAADNLAALSPDSRDLLEAYAAGVNAWLAERGGDLPPELRLLGIQPAPWQALDSMYFQLQLTHDLSFFQGTPEDDRFVELRDLGFERFLDLTGFDPSDIDPQIAAIAANAAPGGGAAALDGPTAADQLAAAPWFEPLQSPGSNNWAVGGSRTASGNAIVANDPHLGLALPSVWYQMSLHAPNYAAQGVTLPGFPFVVLGQGPNVAWAFTNVMLDDHDVFFEDATPDLQQVRRGSTWIAVESHTETVARDGAEPEVVTVRFTDLGVLLPADPMRGLPARSLAWSAATPGDMAVAPLALARAASVEALIGQFETWVAPAQNVVAADRDGGLLYTAVGRVPRRGTTTGRLPAPGWDSSAHWRGLHPQRTNRTVLRPVSDTIVTANAAVGGQVGEGRLALPVADFDTAHRAARISELLGARANWTPAAMGAVQVDIRSRYALEVVDFIDPPSAPGSAAQAHAMLSAWDGTMDGSGAAALFAILEGRLQETIFDESAGHQVGRIDRRKRLLRLLEGHSAVSWFDSVETPAVEDRQAMLTAALESSWDRAAERWGTVHDNWLYGSMHQLHLANPLGSLPLIGSRLNRGPTPWPGSETTVAAFGTGLTAGQERITYGPSMRWISDPTDPDQSLTVLPGGQSGHPFDPHYDDQLALYRRGELRPVEWTTAAAENAAASTLLLRPPAR
jgi:penicillin amidase